MGRIGGGPGGLPVAERRPQPQLCGTYLGKLAQSRPERVRKRVLHGQTIWTIQPPPLPAEGAGEGGHGLAPDWLPDQNRELPGPVVAGAGVGLKEEPMVI
jgi:hypothetical protein